MDSMRRLPERVPSAHPSANPNFSCLFPREHLPSNNGATYIFDRKYGIEPLYRKIVFIYRDTVAL
jgi:hypothetical protein